MYRADPDEHREVRELLVSYCSRLLDDGLSIGSAGNLSVRCGPDILITPTAIPYRDLRPADIALVGSDGTQLCPPVGPAGPAGPVGPAGQRAGPSSELPMHLAVYAATSAQAIVHTHSPEVIALSAACDELPAIHYAIAGLGGPVRVAPYARFGSAELAGGAVAALAGRRAAILQNHGAIAYGETLGEAYDRALLLEWLARVYRLARSYPEPRILTATELGEVVAEARRRGYRAAYTDDVGD